MSNGQLKPPPRLYLPGPATPTATIQNQLSGPLRPHRCPEIKGTIQRIHDRLTQATTTQSVAIFPGGGTLANDAVAANLQAVGKPGIVLSNGEFGERLVAHAKGWQLDFCHLGSDWGVQLPWNLVDRYCADHPEVGWIWLVHGETSTSMLNDLRPAKSLTGRYDLRLCVDCISSLGTAPTELSTVWLATGITGKFLLGVHGLALLFSDNEEVQNLPTVPPSFSMARYCSGQPTPFSIGSSVLLALDRHLDSVDLVGQSLRRAEAIHKLERAVRNPSVLVVGQNSPRIPGLLTLQFAASLNSMTLGERLAGRGFETNYRSSYLVERNWLQIAFIHPPSKTELELLSNALVSVLDETADEAR